MKVVLEGVIINGFTLKPKDGKPGKNLYNMLIDRGDGQKDVMTVFTSKTHEIGTNKAVKITANAFIKSVNEVE
jgi:hypothetical protein